MCAAAARAPGRPTRSGRRTWSSRSTPCASPVAARYGLAAAHGVMEWFEERSLGFPDRPRRRRLARRRAGRAGGGHLRSRSRRTLRPSTDRRRSVDGRCRDARAPDVAGGRSAPAPAPRPAACRVASARRAPSCGSRCRRMSQCVDVTVGALAVVNANGSVVDPSTGLPWEPRPFASRRRRTRRDRARARPPTRRRHGRPSLNTTIGVVATSAALSKAEVGKFAVGRPRRHGPRDPAGALDVRRRHDLRPRDRRRRRHGDATPAMRVPGVTQRHFNLLLAPPPRRSPPRAPTPSLAPPRSVHSELLRHVPRRITCTPWPRRSGDDRAWRLRRGHRVRHPAEMRAWSDAARAAGRTIGLVPTMGALHPGHVELIRARSRLADAVVVSIFVNPLQFDRGDDFDRYPRPHRRRPAACCRSASTRCTPRSQRDVPARLPDDGVGRRRLPSAMEGAARPATSTGCRPW